MYVTGAGFTRAFVRNAPLLVGDFENDRLVNAVRGLRAASRLLEAERNRHPDGFIDIERLMTRLHELMPYDDHRGSTHEFAFLLAELKRAFLRTIQHALDGVEVGPESDVVAFARHCANTSAICITFNYDDLLDAALNAASTRAADEAPSPCASPDSRPRRLPHHPPHGSSHHPSGVSPSHSASSETSAYISSSIRSAMRCAGSRSCRMVQSAA